MSFSLYSVIISSRVGFRVKRYACMVNKLFIYIYIGKCNDVNWYSKGERITILKPSFLTWFPANIYVACIAACARERERENTTFIGLPKVMPNLTSSAQNYGT